MARLDHHQSPDLDARGRHPTAPGVAPFRVAVAPAEIDDLRARLARTRWPEPATVPDWSQGVPLEVLRGICDYWARDYDWYEREQMLNAHPQFMTEIDGLDIHFLHVRSPEPDALPLIVTHGWPGSVFEFLDVLGPLTDPAAHGGDPADAFHVVCPSLPGYGWSGKPTGTGWDVARTAQAWVSLMERLGYPVFAAQGGDWGSRITTTLGSQHGDHLLGVHVNMVVAGPPREQTEFTEAEQESLAKMSRYREAESGYSTQQSTRPQTLGYSLVDSPAGQCAWILEKFYAWTDTDGDPIGRLGADRILDHVMAYWLTASGASAARFYWESLRKSSFWQNLNGASGAPPRQLDATVSVPSGVSLFPKELFAPARPWVERQYTDLRYWHEVDRGGHFAAFEQPGRYVEEVRTFFRLLR